jgi:hypothetical protein
MLKQTFYALCKVGDCGKYVLTFDAHTLALQMVFSK